MHQSADIVIAATGGNPPELGESAAWKKTVQETITSFLRRRYIALSLLWQICLEITRYRYRSKLKVNDFSPSPVSSSISLFLFSVSSFYSLSIFSLVLFYPLSLLFFLSPFLSPSFPRSLIFSLTPPLPPFLPPFLASSFSHSPSLSSTLSPPPFLSFLSSLLLSL